ncbi:hypothetical protein G6F18_013619 [Rhizopus arrhizus]|nr:hypothetical protein G6F18_013619 [Rhizopus arrhizus]KAG0873413.1 hypothetical protein G6F34_014067 [Rhizopus arrhizus]
MAVVSVGAALAQMMLDEDKRELFKYRAEQDCTHEDGVYRDIFDGKIYRLRFADETFARKLDKIIGVT